MAPIKLEDKEDVLRAFNDIGFGAKKATDQEDAELIREMVKLSARKEHDETNTTATKKYYSI